MVPEHPVIGIGFANFPTVINPENVRATVLPVQTDVLDVPIGPHNIVVGTLVELGVVGLILLFGVGRSFFLGRSRTEVAVLARAVMIGFVVQSLFLGIANLKQVWLFAAIVLGLAAADRLRAAGGEAVPDAVTGAGTSASASAARGGASGPTPALAAAAAGSATDQAIPLGPPAAKPRARASTAKAGTSASKPKAAASKPKAADSKSRAKAAPPAEEVDPTLGPEEADPLESITDDTTVATRRGQSVIQLPGESAARRRRTNEVIELPAPTTPPPPEGEAW